MADYDKAVKFFANTPAEAWEALGQKTALSVFQETAKTIPAYQEFLKLQKFDPEDIKTMDDFYKLPTIDKYNYINRYGFNEINTTKAGKNLYSISLSSGTVDQPIIWPRYYSYEEFLPLIFDFFGRMYWQIDRKSTLLIDAYAMGSWIAGFSMYAGYRPLTQKHNFTLATSGADLQSIFYTVKTLSQYYDQTIILSYPTFARTILDKLQEENINLKKINLKMQIAGEGHTVEWRHYINKMINGSENDLTTILDAYGTSDVGLVGLGTALTNLIRDLAEKNKELRKDLFGVTNCVPSLFQYIPANYYIEAHEGELLFTTKSTTPLIRYNLHDRGGLIKFRTMEEILNRHGFDYKKLINKAGLPAEIIWQQPFVYCFGRRDDTIIVNGSNIYPEQVAPAVFNEKVTEIKSFKLTMVSDQQQHQKFVICLELKQGLAFSPYKTKRLKKKCYNAIIDHLKKTNYDFADALGIDPKVVDPRIEIYQAEEGPFQNDIHRVKPRLIVAD